MFLLLFGYKDNKMFPNIKIYTNKMFANTKILWFLMSTNTLFAVGVPVQLGNLGTFFLYVN